MIQSRIWKYDNPTSRFAKIKGYLSFYAGPWRCYVDGEEVIAQPGDFYGGEHWRWSCLAVCLLTIAVDRLDDQ